MVCNAAKVAVASSNMHYGAESGLAESVCCLLLQADNGVCIFDLSMVCNTARVCDAVVCSRRWYLDGEVYVRHATCC